MFNCFFFFSNAGQHYFPGDHAVQNGEAFQLFKARFQSFGKHKVSDLLLPMNTGYSAITAEQFIRQQ